MNCLNDFQWPLQEELTYDVRDFLHNDNSKELEKEKVIDIWQEFINKLPSNEKLSGFPIWASEFGATYPISPKATHLCTSKDLNDYHGSFGIPLKGMFKAEQRKKMPPYDLNSKTKIFPSWKSIILKRIENFIWTIRKL